MPSSLPTVGACPVLQQQDHLRLGGGEIQRHHLHLGETPVLPGFILPLAIFLLSHLSAGHTIAGGGVGLARAELPSLKAFCGASCALSPFPCVRASPHDASEASLPSSFSPNTSLTLCPATQDEECLRPGEATDLTFLEKLEDTVKHHPHFLT